MRIAFVVIGLAGIVATPRAAFAQKIGFEWGVNVSGGGMELGVTAKAANGTFTSLDEKSQFCVARTPADPPKPDVTICLTPDVVTTVSTTVAEHLTSFGLQEFEVISTAYDGKAQKPYWVAVVDDVNMLVAAVSHLCGAPGAIEPAARAVAAPAASREATDAEKLDKVAGDRCFVSYALLRRYLEGRNVKVKWDTEVKDTTGTKIPGVFVKIRDTVTAWTYGAGAQATVDISLEKLSDANVVKQIFDDHANENIFKPAAVGTAAEKRRQNVARLLWHSAVAEAQDNVENRRLNAMNEWDIVNTPGGRKNSYVAYPKSLIGALLAALQAADQDWVKNDFKVGNLKTRCTDRVTAWKDTIFLDTDRDLAAACNAAFTYANGTLAAGAAANPAKVSTGKNIGPVVKEDGTVILMMELRTTQPISVRSALQWQDGALKMGKVDDLMLSLNALWP